MDSSKWKYGRWLILDLKKVLVQEERLHQRVL
jgi:hypothetical protein